MLSDALIAIGVEILQFFNWMLSFFNLPYINKMTDAIQWAVGMIYTLNNTFPVTTLFECMTVLLLCWIFKFQIKLVFETILPMIPFIGKRIQLPSMDMPNSSYDDNTQPYYQAIRPNLGNKNGMGSFYLYKKPKKYRN